MRRRCDRVYAILGPGQVTMVEYRCKRPAGHDGEHMAERGIRWSLLSERP